MLHTCHRGARTSFWDMNLPPRVSYISVKFCRAFWLPRWLLIQIIDVTVQSLTDSGKNLPLETSVVPFMYRSFQSELQQKYWEFLSAQVLYKVEKKTIAEKLSRFSFLF